MKTNTKEYYKSTREYPDVTLWFMDRSNISCAFNQISGKISDESKTSWDLFCSKMSWIDRVCFITTTEREELLNSYLDKSPFVVYRVEEKSRNGDYMAYVWVIVPEIEVGE